MSFTSDVIYSHESNVEQAKPVTIEGDSDTTGMSDEEANPKEGVGNEHVFDFTTRSQTGEIAQLSNSASAPASSQTEGDSAILTNATAQLTENDQMIRLRIELPRVLREDVDVTVQHGVLFVRGCRRIMSVDGMQVAKRQRFDHRYAIDTDVVDVGKATANLRQGVLTITAPKKSRPFKIKIPVTEYDHEDIIQRGQHVPDIANDIPTGNEKSEEDGSFEDADANKN